MKRLFPVTLASTEPSGKSPEFEQWIPLAKRVVQESLALGWNDSLEIYSYIPTIPLAEALSLEARRMGSDTHITLMTDDLWFTSMQELSIRWLRTPSQVEIGINKAITAYVYLGGPRDARRMQTIPPEKFTANSIGGFKQDAPMGKRRVRTIDLPIGRVCPERAEAYELDYDRWKKSYNAALAIDLTEIQERGAEWTRKLRGRKKIRITSNAGTDLVVETKPIEPMVEDGIISKADVRRGFISCTLPAGKIVCAIMPNSAQGNVRFTDPVFMMGRSVRGLSLSFKAGRLANWDADQNKELLTSDLNKGGPSKNRIEWLSIGLNSFAEPCMLDNSIVKDDVGIGLGPHPVLERSKMTSAPYFEGTIGLSAIDVTK